jgi:hypothetical protein
MELNQTQYDNSKDNSPSFNNEIISTEECKQYFGKFELSDQRIADIKNNLVGIVDSIINSYLDNFR